MTSYLLLAAVGLLALYVFNSYRAFTINLQSAKQSGLPYLTTPIYTFNRLWLVTHKLWLPFLEMLPKSWTESWLE